MDLTAFIDRLAEAEEEKTKVKPKFSVDDVLNDIFFAISPTLIVHGAWADAIPEHLIAEIKMQRLAENMRKLRGEEITEATDAEALAYLMTASLEIPFDHKWTRIYGYLFQKFMKQKEPFEEWIELDNYEKHLLSNLKSWILQKRREREKERAKQLRVKEKEAQARKQKHLF